MKITCTVGRVDVSGRHNDRNFDVEKAEHIDMDKSKDNKYYVYNYEYDKPFTEIERQFYKEHFSEYLEDRARKNLETKHPSRVKNIDQYLHEKNTRPEDQLLQIGDKKTHVTPEELWHCAMEFKDRLEKMYEGNCKIIDMALHVDEATPHVHIRRAWIARDEQGLEYISQTQALKQMGIREPDFQKEIGRFNNAKISFTHLERQLFYEICKERGLEVDEPEKSDKQHLSVKEFKEQQIEEHVKELEQRKVELEQALAKYEKVLDPYQEILDRERSLNAREEKLEKAEESLLEQVKPIEDFLSSPYFLGLHEEELRNLERANSRKRAIRLLRMFNKEISQMYKTGNIEKDIAKHHDKIKERAEERSIQGRKIGE